MVRVSTPVHPVMHQRYTVHERAFVFQLFVFFAETTEKKETTMVGGFLLGPKSLRDPNAIPPQR